MANLTMKFNEWTKKNTGIFNIELYTVSLIHIYKQCENGFMSGTYFIKVKLLSTILKILTSEIN